MKRTPVPQKSVPQSRAPHAYRRRWRRFAITVLASAIFCCSLAGLAGVMPEVRRLFVSPVFAWNPAPSIREEPPSQGDPNLAQGNPTVPENLVRQGVDRYQAGDVLGGDRCVAGGAGTTPGSSGSRRALYEFGGGIPSDRQGRSHD
ncbi:MAG: hypothetical protein HC925_08105 [Coleofasciculaceae cyanobacterium SM2_3_26]|nr:hypothetical protein [Coleofasciculaceae cyanobacterium SM2_3_26]